MNYVVVSLYELSSYEGNIFIYTIYRQEEVKKKIKLIFCVLYIHTQYIF